MNEEKILLKIIKNFIEKKEEMVYELVDEVALYKLAVKHKVSNFLVNWAKQYCVSPEIREKVLADYHGQIIKDTNENLELEHILDSFEENTIETVVVKGVTMKEVYPQNYMRQMCDLDLMVHEADFKRVSKIMKELGFEEFYDHEKHLVFRKKPFILVEMHRKLIPGADVSHEYFNAIWPLCVPYKGYENVYQMALEDRYLFCIVHLIRHFKYAGIDIRDVLDVYLFYEKYKDIFDVERLHQKLMEFGAKEFEEKIRKIAYKWFGTNEISDFDEVEQFICKGESIENQIHYAVGEKHGKGHYTARLFFPEMKVMREKYPILKKAPFLLPFTWLARIWKDVFSKETTIKERLHTIQLIQGASQDEVERIQNIYEKLGIIRKED